MADRGMAPGGVDEAAKLKEEKRRFKEEQKKQKQKQAQQKKEAKKKAKEIAAKEAEISEEEGDGTASVVLTTLIIVLVWVGIICALIKLDVGGFGSGVIAPIIKNVPVLNMILPDESTGNAVVDENGEEVDVGGYTSLKEAVAEIEDLEDELIDYQEELNAKNERILALEEEIKRLETFEDMQVEFERIKTEFYNEVVYSEKGPGEAAYQKYYESMDPATAEVLYKQVVSQTEENAEIEAYAQAYSEMKPKQAAAIFEEMTGNLDLAARILGEMEADERGAILGVMDPEVAAKLTKIMEPDS